ncbi:MAG: hypothetical protein A2Z45_10845 [Chloroflexi bacterium RBG_19FT_COMBO_55_16]|nr:MAG: hypothetical protein A2Z45_10845 [Chloroflexi bacterium RBG_19FT_COMBO_55_16]
MAERKEKESKETLIQKSWIVREFEADVRKKELEVEQQVIELEQQNAKLEEKLRNIGRQERILIILTVFFTGLIVFTLGLILLDGFNIGGFSLDTTTLNLLAGTTVAEVAGLLAIALRGIFKSKQE